MFIGYDPMGGTPIPAIAGIRGILGIIGIPGIDIDIDTGNGIGIESGMPGHETY